MDKHFLRWFICELVQEEGDVAISIDGDVMCLDVKDNKFYLYIKSLTYAGNPYPANTTRAQLPRRTEFEKIRTSKGVFLFLGYDEKNEVFACWDPEIVKSRLNYREYVSFFSRLNQQESVKRGVIKSSRLTNGLKYVLFNINDLIYFLRHINDYFQILDKVDSNDTYKQITTDTQNTIQEKFDFLHRISDDNRVKTLVDKLLQEDVDCSMLTMVSKCMNEFSGQYHKMTLKEWCKIINNYINNLKKYPLLDKDDVSEVEENKSVYSSSREKGIVYSDDVNPNYDVLDIEYVKLDSHGNVTSASSSSEIVPIQDDSDGDRSGTRWTLNEVKSLTYFFNEGKDLATLAKLFGRTEIAIKARLDKLGLIEYTYEKEEPSYSESNIEVTTDNLFATSVKEHISDGITIDVHKLKSVFDKKITSYKYFWFMAIISILKDRNEPSLFYEKILIRMAAIAWPIVLDYEIGLGDKDMMSKYLNEIQKKTHIIKTASSRVVESTLTRYYDTLGIKEILRPLLNNVPYRFLSPWLPFTNIEEVMEQSKLDSFDGFYALYTDRIVFKDEWMDYIEKHYGELRDFAYRSFVDYAKQYNNDLKLLKLMYMNDSQRKNVNLEDKVLASDMSINTGNNLDRKSNSKWYFVDNVIYTKTSKYFLSHNCRVVLSELGYYLEVSNQYIKLGDYHNGFNCNQDNVWIKKPVNDKGYRMVHENEKNGLYLIGYIREEYNMIVFVSPDNVEYKITFKGNRWTVL